MVLIGAALGSAAGSLAGRKLGDKYLGEKYGDQSAILGGILGGAGGALLPFKNGGKIPGKKGKGKIILAHGGEYILPVGINPTKSQINGIEKLKKKEKQKEKQNIVK